MTSADFGWFGRGRRRRRRVGDALRNAQAQEQAEDRFYPAFLDVHTPEARRRLLISLLAMEWAARGVGRRVP